MSQQIIIPASQNETTLELQLSGASLGSPIHFAPSNTDRAVDAVVTEIATTTTTTQAPTTTTTTTLPSTTTTTTVAGADVTLFANVSLSLPKLNDGEALELGVKFQSSKAGFIKGIRFYKPSGSTGVHTASLWANSTTKIGSATFVESASGWQQVLFSSPVAISANVTYVASVYSPSGDYISKVGGLSSVVTVAPLATVGSSNGVFKYGTSGYPNATYQSSNYYVDVIFSNGSSSSTTTTTTKVSTTTTTTKAASTTSTTTVVSSGITQEGFGAQVTGGSRVVSISTKADFDRETANISGKILRFVNNLSFSGRYEFTNSTGFTIDANGFDVTLDNGNAGDGISIGAGSSNVILKGLRVINAGNDCINVVEDSHDVLITNCSAYDGRDGNIDIGAVGGRNITVQWCIIGRGQSGWAGDTLVTSENVSLHHNIYAPAGSPNVQERCPYIHANYSPTGNPNCDFRNNVIVGWGRYASGIGYKATANFVNNYYASNKDGAIDPNADPAGNTASYFVSGNKQSGGADINLGGGNHAEFVIPAYARIIPETACAAANRVVSLAGPAKKNAYEQSIINSISLQNCV